MHQEDEENKVLFKKFLLGKCTEEEKNKVLALLNADHADEAFLEIMDQLPELAEAEARQDIKPEVRDRIIANVEQQAGLKKNRFFLSYIKVAAMVLIVFTAGIVMYFSWQDQQGEAPVSYQEIKVPRGAHQEVMLEDGSKVYMNGGSKLTYPVHFAAHTRKLSLEGEAFFEVSHDENKPFIVSSGLLETRVLGTSFNIKAYPEQAKISVGVQSGRVQVSQSDSLNQKQNSSEKQLAILTPNQALIYNISTGDHQTETQLAEEMIGWREGKLIFRKASFKEVAFSLENHFDVQIKFQNSQLENCLFTASFQRDTSLIAVLDMLNLVHGTNFKKIDPNHYFIYGEGC